MEKETRTIFERTMIINEMISPLISATYKQKAHERSLAFHQLISLWYLLQHAVRSLKELPANLAMDPYNALDDNRSLENACMVRYLLHPLEQFALGKDTADAVIFKLHKFCLERATHSGEINIHCTSPMRNLLVIYSHRVYCDVLKTLVDAEKSFKDDIEQKEKAAFDALEKAQQKGRKAKA